MGFLAAFNNTVYSNDGFDVIGAKWKCLLMEMSVDGSVCGTIFLKCFNSACFKKYTLTLHNNRVNSLAKTGC